jgi:site-specific DNA recombinase
VNSLNKEIKKLQKEMVTIIDLFNDDSLKLDADMLKEQLVTKQEAINKKKSILDDITKQLQFKRSKSIMDIIMFTITNFKDFYLTISDDEKKMFFHSVIREIHIETGDKPKDRKIKDIKYYFDLENLGNLVKT